MVSRPDEGQHDDGIDTGGKVVGHDPKRPVALVETADAPRLEDVKDADCVIVAVAHNEFKEMSLDVIKKLYRDCPNDERVLIDVKGLYKVDDLNASGLQWWRL